MARPTAKLVQEYESDLEHSTRHPEPQKDCTRCQFRLKRKQLEQVCIWVDPKSGKEFSWLMEAPGANIRKEAWGLGCVLCHWAQYKNQWGRCLKKTLRDLRRHSEDTKHKQALQRFLEQNETDGQAPEPGGQAPDRGVGYAQVLKLLETVEQNNSLRSFASSMENLRSMGGDVNPGNSSRRVARNLLTLCAGNELHVTKQLLDTATVCGLAQDARDAYLLICARMVLWKLPPAVRDPLANGIMSFGDKHGPWVAERIVAVPHLGADRSAVAVSQATLQAIRDVSKTDESFE